MGITKPTAALARLLALTIMLQRANGGPGEPSIRWDSANPVLVQQGGHYGRIARLDPQTLIAGFDLRREIHVRLSRDEGKTWQPPVRVAGLPDGTCTNTELLVLKNGGVLCFFNFRPRKDSGLPFTIAFSRSGDQGATWSPPRTLHAAGTDFGDGCWEPAAVELPDGELHVYFANEGPYRKSSEQEISLLRSQDGGATWSGAERVSFRKGHRDGMPVPLVDADRKRIHLAIEDNGLSGAFKPVIVSTMLERGGWRGGHVDADSGDRRGALAHPLPAASYAGAPYLRRFPGGPCALSFQLAKSGDMNHSRMAVCLGTPDARDFGKPSYPFPEGKHAQLWNALFVKNADTLTAISETTLRGTRGIWIVDGRLAHGHPGKDPEMDGAL